MGQSKTSLQQNLICPNLQQTASDYYLKIRVLWIHAHLHCSHIYSGSMSFWQVVTYGCIYIYMSVFSECIHFQSDLNRCGSTAHLNHLK